MHYVRIYTDDLGESHMEDVTVELFERDFAPPARPVHVGAPIPAAQIVFFVAQPGWDGSWHPTPRRQYFAQLAGEFEVEVTDGTVRRFGPGDVALLDDVTGRGHETRVVGDSEARGMFVQLPE